MEQCLSLQRTDTLLSGCPLVPQSPGRTCTAGTKSVYGRESRSARATQEPGIWYRCLSHRYTPVALWAPVWALATRSVTLCTDFVHCPDSRVRAPHDPLTPHSVQMRIRTMTADFELDHLKLQNQWQEQVSLSWMPINDGSVARQETCLCRFVDVCPLPPHLSGPSMSTESVPRPRRSSRVRGLACNLPRVSSCLRASSDT